MTPDPDAILGRAARRLREQPDEPHWVDISSAILSRVRSTARRTWPVDAAFPTSVGGRANDSVRVSDHVVRRAVLRALTGIHGCQPIDVSLYLDEHECVGLSIAVVGVYGSDLQAVGNGLARIAIDVVNDVLGVALVRDDVEVRVDDIEV